MKWGPGKLLYIHIASASAETMQELSVAELKERLKAKGLPVGGKKADLVARLTDGEEE